MDTIKFNSSPHILKVRLVQIESSCKHNVIEMIELYLTFSQITNFRLFQTERVCRRQFIEFMKMVERYLKRYKTLWEKEKLLVMSNFSFSLSVFKRLVLQTRKNQGLFGKGLKG